MHGEAVITLLASVLALFLLYYFMQPFEKYQLNTASHIMIAFQIKLNLASHVYNYMHAQVLLCLYICG